jgi:hypothetical protein
MSQVPNASLNIPAQPNARRPMGPDTCSLLRTNSDTLVFGPARPTGWPTRANSSLGGWLALWAILGGMILAGGLLWLLIVGVAVTLPAYWSYDAISRGAWSEFALAGILQIAIVGLLVLGVLALASDGRWITFDRKDRNLTVKRRPFGWQREPRVVESRSLDDVVAVQLIFGGVTQVVLVRSPYDEHIPPITQDYYWYEFNVVFRDSPVSRMTIASGRDWVWKRQAGRELAEFLGVPLVDRLAHGLPSAAPNDTGDGGA